MLEDWLYFNSYGQETLLINLFTCQIYYLSNKWFGRVIINPTGTIFACIGHVQSMDTVTVFYELIDPVKNTECLILIPFDESIGKLQLVNNCGCDMENYEWIENNFIKYTKKEFFYVKANKFICEMDDDDDEWKDDFIVDDKHCDKKFYCEIVLQKVNNKMSVIEERHSPESLFYKYEM